MLISVNGSPREVEAATLAALLAELDYADVTVATALNHAFVRAVDRPATPIREGDAVEILTPRQGG